MTGGKFEPMSSLLHTPSASAITAYLLLAVTAPTLTTGHSWIEKLEGPHGNGMSRMGMPTKSDSALIRYFCPHENLDDCQVDAKHGVILEESAKRPCRSDMVSDPKTPTRPGADLVLHWAANGHANNGQSDGTCVKVMIAPFAEDPSIEDFAVVPGAECLPYWIISNQGSVETEGSITIPANLDPGTYTLFWHWNFLPFHFASCADIDVLEGDFPSYEEMVETYLMDGCANLPNPDEFCRAYSGFGENSRCDTDESLKDECGRSSCEGLGGGSMLYDCVDCPPPTPGPPGCPPPKAFYDDFSNGFDPNKWLIAHKSWNPNSGGVVAENVHFDSNSKRVVFNAHGLLYDGDIMGVKKEGTTIYRADSGLMTGGAIATRDYFGAGSYEVRMKVAEELGVCSAIWTYFWKDGTPIVNHEIDIELPGRPNPAHLDIGFDYALMNTFVGESGSLVETNFTKLDQEMNDGEFHNYRFDWHTDESDRRVEFFVDGKLLSINRENVPYFAGRLWVGAWFPNSWAGVPNFDVSQMVVDYVKFTPFENELYECPLESIPEFGWAPDTIFPESGEESGDGSAPVKCKTPPPAPTSPAPSPVATAPPVTAAPVHPPTNPPVSPPTGNSPESYAHYYSNGCKELHVSFCENDSSGSYCKSWQNDGTACQRSICHGHDFTVLDPCAPPPITDEEIYKSSGCEHLQNRDGFCVGLLGGQSYCKYWSHDHCQRAICQGDDFSSLDSC